MLIRRALVPTIKVLACVAPFILVLAEAYSGGGRSRYLEHHAASASALPDEARRTGIHIYGWAFEDYALLGTFPYDPDLDTELAIGMFTARNSKYLARITGHPDPPPFILDQFSVGEGGWLRDVPTINQWRRGDGAKAFERYQRVERTPFGVLFRRRDE